MTDALKAFDELAAVCMAQQHKMKNHPLYVVREHNGEVFLVARRHDGETNSILASVERRYGRLVRSSKSSFASFGLKV